MREQIAPTAGFNRVSGKEGEVVGGRKRRRKKVTRRMQRARGKGNRNNRGNYLRACLRVEKTGGNEIEEDGKAGGGRGGRVRLGTRGMTGR